MSTIIILGALAVPFPVTLKCGGRGGAISTAGGMGSTPVFVVTPPRVATVDTRPRRPEDPRVATVSHDMALLSEAVPVGEAVEACGDVRFGAGGTGGAGAGGAGGRRAGDVVSCWDARRRALLRRSAAVMDEGKRRG